jgi:multidrug efflux system membrane fusion protein
MNEFFKPSVAERAQPAPPAPEPPPPLAPAKPAPRRRSFVGRLALIVAIAALAVFAWQKFERVEAPTGSEKGGRNSQPPQTVRVAAAALGDMPITIDALGTVAPFETVTIKTQIAGKLMAVGFTEGQIVKKGDFLAQIDPLPYEAALAQAKGQLAKDQALRGQAQSDLSRYEALAKQDSISKQQVTDQEMLVQQDTAAIQTDQAQVQTAQVNLDYTHIVSPVTGRVGLRLVDPGNYLQPSDTTGIVVITQIDPISVVFPTSEDNLPRIAARLNSGAALKVTVYDRANVHELATGTLTTYDSQIDNTTGTIKMRATFDNASGVLFPQQFVNVRLLVDTLAGVVLAPNAAVQLGPSGSFVYLLSEDGTVSKRDIEIGPANGKSTTVTKGLAAGDKVVIDGVDRLRDGSKVNVVGDSPEGVAEGQGQNQPGRRYGGGGAAGESGGDAQGRPRRRLQGGQEGAAGSPASGESLAQGAISGAADGCASGLPPEAKAIYDAAAREFASSQDPRALVRAKVADLVKSGKVQQESARESAMTAGDCLRRLSSTATAGAPAGAKQPASALDAQGAQQ